MAAKWLLADPQVFVFEEPTRGVDVNARIELYRLINEVAQAGKAVILIRTTCRRCSAWPTGIW